MLIDIDGSSLTADDVLAVSRHHASVRLTESALQRIARGRRTLEDAIARGERIYGATTSVGAKTSMPISAADAAEFNRRLLLVHNVGHGPVAEPDVARATMLVLLNAFASGRSGVRSLLAEKLALAINSNITVEIHVLGSMGQSDMSAMSDLALAVFNDIELVAGEALAILNSSALSTALAVLAAKDLERLLRLSTLVAALSMEGFAANPSPVSKIALESRPHEGLRIQGEAIRRYLDGSYICEHGGPRNHQDPLCFRSLPLIHGSAHDNIKFALQQIALELNASQGNPVISIDDDGLAACANFDMVTLCMALDVLRLAFGPVLTSSTERLAKMADHMWSGLSVGLIEEDGIGAPGFNGMALVHKSLTSEARLLMAPVASELPSSSHSNGVLDRVSLAALGARRAAEMFELGKSIIAMEMIVAAQAIELRGKSSQLGRGTSKLFAFVREAIPYTAKGQRPPNPKPLLDHLDKNKEKLDAMMDEMG